jgi:hypothetical protein
VFYSAPVDPGLAARLFTVTVPVLVLAGAVVPAVRPGGSYTVRDGMVQLTAMTRWPDGSGCGISVLRDDWLAERIAFLADGFQDAEVENLPASGLSAVWPSRPDHPDTHPLQAEVRGHDAVRVCPATTRPVARIGRLP